MNAFRRIRTRLNLSQAELGRRLGMSQGNISNYEKEENPQTVLPEVAKALIALAKDLGHDITFNDIYAADDSQQGGEPSSENEERSSASGSIYEERQRLAAEVLERAVRGDRRAAEHPDAGRKPASTREGSSNHRERKG